MLLEGKKFRDERGSISFNNEFDASEVKRIYIIQNESIDFTRGWQGHAIEKRWFAAVCGEFEISVIKIDDFKNPSKTLEVTKFHLNDESLSYLHVPAGHITAIKSTREFSRLLVLADHALGEIQDEYRFPLDYFITNI